MKLLNYNIANDFIALEYGDLYLDLHNNLDFVGLEYNLLERTLLLKWVKSSGEWVSSNTPERVVLAFHGVNLFKSKERDSSIPFTEDNCLESIGFIHNQLIEELEGFSSASPLEHTEHLNISFASGFAVKIGAESSVCHVENNM